MQQETMKRWRLSSQVGLQSEGDEVMNRVLLNQKEVSKRKGIRSLQKQSIRAYGKGKSVIKAKIGKLVSIVEDSKNEPFLTKAVKPFDIEALLHAIKSVQLTGMSGNGYPVHGKIEKVLQSPSRIFIINGVECEPGLLHDRWLLENHWEGIRSGIEALQEAIGFDRCILAYSMSREQRKSKQKQESIEICHVPSRYPMGEERCLIHQVLGKEIGKEEYPAEQGILVLNVQTVFQIACILSNTYQNGRYITAANMETGEAKVIYVERNTNIKQRMSEIFPANMDSAYFAGGGIMAAHEVTDEDTFTDSICFVAVGKPAHITNEHTCKGCGKCNRKCPAGVNIREIVKRREKDIHADISGLGMEKCIHCGCCIFFCRAGKDTLAYFD